MRNSITGMMFVYFPILLFAKNYILTKGFLNSPNSSTHGVSPQRLDAVTQQSLTRSETSTIFNENAFSSDSVNVPTNYIYSRDSYTSTMAATDNGTTQDLLQLLWEMDICKAYTTCNYSSQQKYPQCKCDQSCYLYNDCCYEMLGNSTDFGLKLLSFTCVSFNSTNPDLGTFIVKSCPDYFPDNITKTNCMDDDFVKVGSWVLDNNNRIFKNRYCAICNGIFTFTPLPVAFYNIGDYILSEENYKNMSSLDRFSYLYDSGLSTYSIRIPSEARRCIIVEPDNSLCMTYAMSPVKIYNEEAFGDEIYRNMYCIPPNVNAKSPLECITNEYQQFLLPLSPGFGFYQLFPLTVLFSFDEDRDTCPNEFSCQSKEEYSNLHIELMFSISGERNISSLLLRQLVLGFAWSIHIVNQTFISNLGLWYPNQESNRSSAALGIISLILRRKCRSLTEMTFYQNTISNITWKVQVNSVDTREEFNLVTVDPDYKIYEEQHTEVVWELKKDEDLYQIMQSYNMKINSQPTSFICETVLIRSDLSGDLSIHDLTIKDVNCIYDDIKRSPRTARLTKTGMIFTYLTYTGCSLSIFTLILSIIFCRKCHVTKSIHGTNLENLSIALILAKLLFIVGIGANDNQQICSIIGISLHYVWLTVFSFKSVAIVYMVQDIRKMSKQRSDADDNLCCQKCGLTLIGAFIPALLVGPAVALQYIFLSPMSPQYGGSICFPSAYPANVIFVSGPIIMSIIINTTCLIFMIVYISKNNEEAKSIRRFDSFPQVKVYLRISIITGVFWITGILSAIFQEQILDYVFVITCSLQGFFIAIANMTTKRVSGSMKKSLRQLTFSSRSRSSKQKFDITETGPIEDPVK